MERKKDLGDRSERSRTRAKWRDDRERIRLMENDLERWMPMTAVILTAEQHAQVRSALRGCEGQHWFRLDCFSSSYSVHF